MEAKDPATLSQGSHAAHDSNATGMSIGSSKEEDVERINELEDQVKELAEKANTASQKYADYENEIRVLEAKLRQEQRKNNASNAETTLSAPQAAQRPNISRFGSFMGTTRKTSSPLPEGASQTPASREKDLEEQLVKEQTLRIAAEKKVKEASAEIEDLSAQLFSEANEMVATERKQNAELKEKLQILEEQYQQPSEPTDAQSLRKENLRLKQKLQTLEQRDTDRKKRLERLEAANKRIDRTRAMLHPP